MDSMAEEAEEGQTNALGWVSRWFGGLMDGEVKVGKTIEIAADWARPSVLPPNN